MRLKFWTSARPAGRRKPATGFTLPKAFRPRLEQLMDRILPSVTIQHADGRLTVTGDDAPDAVVVRTSGLDILVNGQSTGHTILDTNELVVDAGGGNDVIDLAQFQVDPAFFR